MSSRECLTASFFPFLATGVIGEVFDGCIWEWRSFYPLVSCPSGRMLTDTRRLCYHFNNLSNVTLFSSLFLTSSASGCPLSDIPQEGLRTLSLFSLVALTACQIGKMFGLLISLGYSSAPSCSSPPDGFITKSLNARLDTFSRQSRSYIQPFFFDIVLRITLADNFKVTDLNQQPSPILYEIDSVQRTEQLTVVLIADRIRVCSVAPLID